MTLTYVEWLAVHRATPHPGRSTKCDCSPAQLARALRDYMEADRRMQSTFEAETQPGHVGPAPLSPRARRERAETRPDRVVKEEEEGK